MHRFVIRQAQLSDIDDIQTLSRQLNSANLPNRRDALEIILKNSEESFTGRIQNPLDRVYVFVMVDQEKDHLVGTSQIIARHGTPQNPHTFFEVGSLEHRSRSVNKHFDHEILQLRWNDNGPTEVGGIVVAPEYQQHPEKLGKQLSFVRFMFISTNRALFQNTVVAELMPTLTESGQSPFWDALGHHFTELDYHEACFLSRNNREFVVDLFPHHPIYTCLLNQSAREAIGVVGAHSQAAERLLKSIGFRHQERVDALDAGPHIEAATDTISLVQNTHTGRVATTVHELDNRGLIMHCRDLFSGDVQIRCIYDHFTSTQDGNVLIKQETALALRARVGDIVHALYA